MITNGINQYPAHGKIVFHGGFKYIRRFAAIRRSQGIPIRSATTAGAQKICIGKIKPIIRQESCKTHCGVCFAHTGNCASPGKSPESSPTSNLGRINTFISTGKFSSSEEDLHPVSNKRIRIKVKIYFFISSIALSVALWPFHILGQKNLMQYMLLPMKGLP